MTARLARLTRSVRIASIARIATGLTLAASTIALTSACARRDVATPDPASVDATPAAETVAAPLPEEVAGLEKEHAAGVVPAPKTSRPRPGIIARETQAEVPPDVIVTVEPAELGPPRLVVRHGKRLVALRGADGRDTGEGFASIPVESAGSVALWESTSDELETIRGVVHLDAERIRLDVRMAEPPRERERSESARHACRAHEDGQGGFAVLCRVKDGAWRFGAVNLMTPLPGDDVRVVRRPTSQLVRLDLPLAEADAAASMIGYMQGQTAVVVRAEASWLAGEAEPSLSLAMAERVQPASMPRFRHWHRHPFPRIEPFDF